MAHHKRRRPKKRRAGCLFCKPHKGNGTKGSRAAQTLQEQRARVSEREQRRGAT
jgi:radical SAM superfamily enzyme